MSHVLVVLFVFCDSFLCSISLLLLSDSLLCFEWCAINVIVHIVCISGKRFIWLCVRKYMYTILCKYSIYMYVSIRVAN